MKLTALAVVILALTAFLLGACGGEEEVSPDTAPEAQPNTTAPDTAPPPQSSPTAPAGGPVTFETVEIGDQSGFTGDGAQVLKIETEAEWEEFWSRHRANVPPAVDFSREMVIAAVDGREPSGGYQFEITAIEDDGSRLVVRVSKAIPGPGCVVTQVITQPFHIVRLANSEMGLDLILSDETYSCE